MVAARTEELLPLIMAETGATLAVGTALQVPQADNGLETDARGTMMDLRIPLSPSVVEETPLAAGGLIGGVVDRQPVGVVACISPYNFPPGVISLVTSSSPEAGQALAGSHNVDMISFTGSKNLGVAIYEGGARTMKRLLLELGVKGGCIVWDDADLTRALTALVSVWSFHSGQICTAPTRAIVLPDTVVGPVISGIHRERAHAHLRLPQRHASGPGGDLRADDRGHSVRHRRKGDRDCE